MPHRPPTPGPLVSVVIPAYNAAAYLAETLDSVLRQTYDHVEVIVVDDGSTDGTRDCVRSYGNRVRYVYQQNSGGCSKPRNEGIRVASGPLLLFADADDIMAPDRIATLVQFLRAEPRVALAFSNYQDFDDRGRHEEDHFATCRLLSRRLASLPPGAPGLVLESADGTELLLTENFGSASPMVRRAAIDAVGTFDETLKACEDFDFQYRVAARFPIGVIPRVGWYKRLHRASMSADLSNCLRHKIVTRQRLLDAETDRRRRRKLTRTLATFHWTLAYHATGHDNAVAFRHALASLRLRGYQDPRLMLRILLDVLGRSALPRKVSEEAV